MQCVQVKLELGHKAAIRKKPTQEGFTHDWSVFVRGPDGSNIQHFIEKVIFHLHDSFPKPKRSIKEPPYQVSESGYAGFTLPVEVCFRTKEEPKRVKFDYDLFLHLEGPPVNNVRCEKLTFRNPAEDFKEKLLKAGGVIVARPDGVASNQQQHVEVSQTLQPPVSLSALVPSMNASNNAPSNSDLVPNGKPKIELQEQPKIKPKLPSSNHSGGNDVVKKHKSSSGKSHKHDKSHSTGKTLSLNSKHSSDPLKVKTSSGSNKKHRDKDELKKKFCIAAFVKSPSDEKVESVTTNSSSLQQEPKPHRERVALKSPASSSLSQPKQGSGFKKSNEDLREVKPAEKTSAKPEKKKSSSSSLPKEYKEGKVKENKNYSKDDKPLDKRDKSDSKKKKSSGGSSKTSGDPASKEKKKEKSESSKHKNTDSNSDSKIKSSGKHKHFNGSSKRSESPVVAKGYDQVQNNHIASPVTTKAPLSPTRNIVPKHHSSKSSKSSSHLKNGESSKTKDLIELQTKIMQLQDRRTIQKIVDVIEENSSFKVREKTFDFDLHSLDKETVRKLKLVVSGLS